MIKFVQGGWSSCHTVECSKRQAWEAKSWLTELQKFDDRST